MPCKMWGDQPNREPSRLRSERRDVTSPLAASRGQSHTGDLKEVWTGPKAAPLPWGACPAGCHWGGTPSPSLSLRGPLEPR